MNTQAAQELYGLIGYPVKHSLSAVMYNAAFQACGIRAEYKLFEVAPADLEDFFKKIIFEKKIRGFNVTIPHKETALKFLTGTVSGVVKMIGAVNTVRVRADGLLSGVNTDEIGFMKDLKAHDVSIKDKSIALIGAGGGARAVAFCLAARQPSEVHIFDVDQEKAKELVRNIQPYYPHVSSVPSLEELGISDANILVNATPVGLKESDPLLVKEEWLHPGLFVYDLIYNPAQTKLVKTAREKGCRVANGLGMLLYQGAGAFEYWMGKEAPVEVMRKALEGAIHV